MLLFKCNEIVESVCVISFMTKNESNSEFFTFLHNLQWIYLNISEFLILDLHLPVTTCLSGNCHLELSSLCDQKTYRDNRYCIKVYWQFSYLILYTAFWKIKWNLYCSRYVVVIHFETKDLFYMPFILNIWVWFHFAVNVIIF